MEKIKAVFEGGQLYHAYCLTTLESDQAAAAVFQSAAETYQVPLRANPDFCHLKTKLLSLEADHHHEIRDWHSRKALYGVKICVIEAERLSIEAQNSLLKTFEEPLAQNYFFLVLPHTHTLLPTLLSRLQRLEVGAESQTTTGPSVEEFFAQTPAERLKMLSPLIDNKDRHAAYIFLEGLEQEIYRRSRAEPSQRDSLLRLGLSLSRLKLDLLARSSWVKGVLEYTALTLPHYKLNHQSR